MSNFRKDVDFSGLFRKLGHSLDEIRVRALESILSKLEHKLICEADLVQEKQLYIRLLEWFNIPRCSHKAQVLELMNKLAQLSVGAQILQDIGAVEFLSQLRCDIEPCHKPAIDLILEHVMCLPDSESEGHAPECIYHRPTDSAVWGASMSSMAGEGSRSQFTEPGSVARPRPGSSVERLSGQLFLPSSPGYFNSPVGDQHQYRGLQDRPQDNLFLTPSQDNGAGSSLFRLSMFPWLPLTHTDQQVIASTNSSLQTKDPAMLIGSCEFLADVVFQDFPPEIFFQRPEILKSLLSLVSLSNPEDYPVVIQACKTLAVFIRCLQVRIRYFQDPCLYTSKQDFDSTPPSTVASTPSSGPPSSYYSGQGGEGVTPHLPLLRQQRVVAGGAVGGDVGARRDRGDVGGDVGARRDRGDGQDRDSSSSVSASRDSSVGLEPDAAVTNNFYLLESDCPRPRHQQLSLPQLCVAVLQRALPRLRTAHLQLGTAVLDLGREALAVLSSVLDQSVWTDTQDAAREVVDRVTDSLECIADLLDFHHHSHHSESPRDPELGELTTHRILYMGVAAALTRFLTMIPVDKMNAVLPERLSSRLASLVYDQPLAVAYPQCRVLSLAVSQSLSMSMPADFHLCLDMCRSLTRTCSFCMQIGEKSTSVESLAGLAEDALPSLGYHLHLPFVSKFVNFTSTICSKKKTEKAVVTQCTEILLKMMSFPVDSVRDMCHVTILDIVKQSLQVSHASSLRNKESLKSKFVMNADVMYQLAMFGLSDSSAKVRHASSECLHHLLQSQLLMSEGLWQEFMMALVKALPVLQSYTDETTALGRRLLSLLDPTTTSHNISLLDKLRACLRLLYVPDKKMRVEAGKHLQWFMSNEHSSEMKCPGSSDLDPAIITNCLILANPSLTEDNLKPSVFTDAGMLQVLDIFTSTPVDPVVKKSAADQLAAMMKDSHLHAVFKEKGGVEVVSAIIDASVYIGNGGQENETDGPSCVPACVTMLKHLVHQDYSLRHTLARDNNLYYTLLRVALTYTEDASVKSDVSHLIVLLLFDEVAKFDIRSGEADTPGTRYSLPLQVIQRYRLPFKSRSHHETSPNTPTLAEPESDVLRTSGPTSMMRVAWNLAWLGGLDPMLDAFTTGLWEESNSEFDPSLRLSDVERIVLQMSSVCWQLRYCLASVRTAASHSEVTTKLDRMLALLIALPGGGVTNFLSSTSQWYAVLERFLMVTPISSSDQKLLLSVLKFISCAIQCLKSRPSEPSSATPSALTWLIDRLYRPEGPIMSLMKRQGEDMDRGEADPVNHSIKRSLDKQMLQYVIGINIQLPYQLCKRTPPIQLRGDFVRCLQHRLNVSEAPHFYNLASLEGTLSCLMHVTARPGWSRESSGLDASSLCNQLLNSLLEVVWSFHIGRGGTSVSFMGKGVTKSTALCLRHLAYEMSLYSEDEDWVKNWLYSRQDGSGDGNQGLNWLLTLWAYRDSEVRVAGLGIAVALTSTEAGRLMVTNHCKHVPGGIWGAAFSILLDPVECSMVCQQAALLLVNLTSQTMPSGDTETTGAAAVGGGRVTWQGPLVTDEDYQVVLVGLKALEALVSHVHLYASVADLLTNICWSNLVQPVLVNTELPLGLDDASVASIATDNFSDRSSSLEKTGRTALTTVTTLSSQPPTDQGTARSKSEKSSAQNSSITSTTTVGTETPRPVQQSVMDNTPGSTGPRHEGQVEGHSITTPGLVSAVVRLLSNLVQLSPPSCLAGLRAHGILSTLVSLVNPRRVQSLCSEMTSAQSSCPAGPALCDLLTMYQSIVDLMTTCITLDTSVRAELLDNRTRLTAMASLLLFLWHGKDDIGEKCKSLSVSVLQLLSSLLTAQGPTALLSLSVALGPIWKQLTDSLIVNLSERSQDLQPLLHSTLDFLALLLLEESRSSTRDPDRILETATVSELLDASLTEGEDSNVRNTDEETAEISISSSQTTTGQMLCKALIGLFEPAMAVSWEEKAKQAFAKGGDPRLKILGALKSVLAVSQTAKHAALDAGLGETTLEQLKQTHAQLNLETLGLTNIGGKKEGPLLQEIVVILDFLRSFMHNSSDVKVACHHSGLTGVIQRLWAWSQQESSLQSSVLSILVTYTAHCNSAASSLTASMSVSASAVKSGGGATATGSGGSLLHYVLRLTQKELDRDECSPLLRLTFSLLTNLALNADCRNVLWKSPFVNQFSQLDPRKRRGKVRVAVDGLWCDLILALSFSTDGQQIVLRIPDCLTVLLDLMEAGSSQCQRSATLIVRNLCCHAPNKPKLLAADKLINCLVNQIEKTEETTQLIATSALWALVHNNHKARVHVKAQNVAPRLVEVLHTLQASSTHQRTPAAGNSCQNLRAVISVVRD